MYSGRIALLGVILVSIAGFGFVSQRRAPQRQPGTLSASDKAFVNEAARGGMAEVRLGQIAVKQAASPDVKQFGQRMIDDHTAANNELSQLVSAKGLSLPAALDTKDKANIDKLSKLTGAAFDRQYMDLMVSDHKKDVAVFERESTRAGDPELKSWIVKTLPTLKTHLQLATETHSKLRGR
jgi:putative membrane protein